MVSSSALFGALLLLILVLAFILVRKQTQDLIEPINTLDLEHPLGEVRYEELRPLLERVDEQNHQIAKQMEELKEAEAVRREFSLNVSHELKTPLMSISGYAELMMNGMVPGDKIQEFSGRIYHEASRLSTLVTDIIQLSRLDEKDSDMPFEPVDLYERQRISSFIWTVQHQRRIFSYSLRERQFSSRVCVRSSMRCCTILRTMQCAIRIKMES